MKTIAILITALAVAAPTLSFAQGTPSGLSREQVRAELIQLQEAGYNESSGSDAHYPEDVQKATAKIAAAEVATMQTDDAVVRVSEHGSSEAAKPATVPSSTCVGPVSYCNIYFGG